MSNCVFGNMRRTWIPSDALASSPAHIGIRLEAMSLHSRLERGRTPLRLRSRSPIGRTWPSQSPPFRARSEASAVIALFALTLILSGCNASEPEPAPPERIFLFVVDTLRRDHVSAYGARASTPNMDALAARGVRIDNAFAAYHQTTMSMAALFTGRTPALEKASSLKKYVSYPRKLPSLLENL